MAGRMGTERGETVRTLYKAPARGFVWTITQADRSDLRPPNRGRRAALVSVLDLWVYELLQIIIKSCIKHVRRAGLGARSPTGGSGRHRDRVGGGRLGWLTPVNGSESYLEASHRREGKFA